MVQEATGTEWLRLQNPWWEDPADIDSDLQVMAWKATPARYRPALMDRMAYDYEPGRQVIYTIRGARQVGKTTMIKLLIRDFLRRGVEPMCVCYCLLSPLFNSARLVRTLLKYMELSEPYRTGKRAYVFLDEVSTVKQWQAGLLTLSNMNTLRNCTILATGSNAVDLRRASETLPGRMGLVPDGPHKVLLPMSFSEYASLRSSGIDTLTSPGNVFDPNLRKDTFAKLVNGVSDPRLEQMCSHTRLLDDLLYRYMITGGLARIVNITLQNYSIPEPAYLEHSSALMSEWSMLGNDPESLFRYVRFILKAASSTMTWHGLAKEAGLTPSHRASNFAYLLRDMYVLTVAYAYDVHKKTLNTKKAKKLHIRDPFFLHALNGHTSNKPSYNLSLDYLARAENRGHMAECIAADHLTRMAYEFTSKKAAFDPSVHILYWKDRRDREVDFIYRHATLGDIPIEIKYGPRINRRKLGGLTAFLDASGSRRGIVASRHDYEIRRDYTLVPLSVLLMLA